MSQVFKTGEHSMGDLLVGRFGFLPAMRPWGLITTVLVETAASESS
jgi:hypothetical protein